MTCALIPYAVSDAFGFGLSFSSSNKASLQAPGYEKLTNGAGPTADDIHGELAGADSASQAPTANTDLRPLTLSGTNATEQSQTAGDNADGGVLKSTVSATEYLPKDDNGKVLESKSIKGDPSGKKLLKDASKVGLGPVQLTMSDEEANNKVDTILTAEQMQLNDLWEATLTRSPDIQFIVQKLQPTSNPAHLSNFLMRALSTAAFGGLGAAAMISPNMGMYAATSMGGSMIQTALGMKESKNAKAAKLSQEEQLMMFNMVRNTCDKLVGSYRDYKKNAIAFSRASNDLQDLQSMVSEARSGQDSAKQLEMEYTLRKQQRDVEAISDDIRKHRQNLVDLAGAEAIAKLDKQIAEEQVNISNGVAKTDGVAKPIEPAGQPGGGVDSAVGVAKSDVAPTGETVGQSEGVPDKSLKTKTASTLSPQS